MMLRLLRISLCRGALQHTNALWDRMSQCMSTLHHPDVQIVRDLGGRGSGWVVVVVALSAPVNSMSVCG